MAILNLLFLAVLNNEPIEVKQIIQIYKIDPTEIDEELSISPLDLAIKLSRVKIVTYFLQLIPSIFGISSEGISHFEHAMLVGNNSLKKVFKWFAQKEIEFYVQCLKFWLKEFFSTLESNNIELTFDFYEPFNTNKNVFNELPNSSSNNMMRLRKTKINGNDCMLLTANTVDFVFCEKNNEIVMFFLKQGKLIPFDELISFDELKDQYKDEVKRMDVVGDCVFTLNERVGIFGSKKLYKFGKHQLNDFEVGINAYLWSYTIFTSNNNLECDDLKDYFMERQRTSETVSNNNSTDDLSGVHSKLVDLFFISVNDDKLTTDSVGSLISSPIPTNMDPELAYDWLQRKKCWKILQQTNYSMI
eukprot:TRINITY_DN1400_c0_g1_i1.p1 TRINITY_DN1400_c0_g1~~TRINITY_DN1400_c0_g1_i1.p1  ORF type:complete len:359 (+),score=95.56 TRINITY_DN1400_c0_g1_i1:53-1129(+)